VSIVPRYAEFEWTPPVADDEEELENEHDADDEELDGEDIDGEFEDDEFGDDGEFDDDDEGDDLEEDEDDEDEVVAPPITATEGDKVAPKRDGEWTCTGCFLIVSARQFGKRETATCPSGVGDCPSLEML